MAASCFPFMKYIFLLVLFIICFTLIYTTTLELLGLGVFFVVNVMYSAFLGMDISKFFAAGFSGSEPTKRWLFIVALILVIALVFNFVSSVLTMMTMANLRAKFGKKGEKLLLAPTYRKVLDHIEALFVSSIVFITILSFRIYVSPAEMSSSIFAWLGENIPDDVMKWGHVVLSMVAFGLGIAVFDLIKHTDKLPVGFTSTFTTLFYVLMALLLFYMFPSLIHLGSTIPLFGGILTSLFGLNEGSLSGRMGELYTKYSISAYTLLKTIFVVLIFSITGFVDKNNTTTAKYEKNEKYVDLPIVSYSIMSVLLVTLFAKFLFQTHPGFFTDTLKWNIGNATLGLNIVDLICALVLFITVFALSDKNDTIVKGNVFDTAKETPGDSVSIYYKMLSGLLITWPLITLVLFMLGSREVFKLGTDSKTATIMQMLSSLTTAFSLNLVDAFYIVKTFLLFMVVIFAGLTINQYHKIPGADLEHKYGSMKLKEIFGSFMAFLMVVVSMSLFNAKNLPRILTLVIEYLTPIAILIIVSYLVYYSDDMSKLTTKELIAGVSNGDAGENNAKQMKNPPTEKISGDVYSG